MSDPKLIVRPAAEITVEEIASLLGKGLAGTVVGKVGALLINAIFPAEVPSYFDQVYAEISQIVKQAIQQDTIDSINGQIDGTQAWVKDYYLSFKDSHEFTPAQLVDMLQGYIDPLQRNVLYTLQQPDYSRCGFSVFLVAAGLQMALVQEQAQVDPNAVSPAQSLYTKILGKLGTNYSKYALDTLLAILIDRRQAVTLNSVYLSPTYFWQWVDSVSKQSSDLIRDKSLVEADMQRHVDSVLSQLLESLQYPAVTAVNWTQPALEFDAVALNMSWTSNDNGYFYDYSNIENYIRRLTFGWTAYGAFGWMASPDGKQSDAVVPIYRLVATADPSRVLIVFDQPTFLQQQTVGWNGNGEGLGLLGYIWSDPTKIAAGAAVAVYPLIAEDPDQARTLIVTTEEEYKHAQTVGWEPVSPPGVVGYMCSQG
jgi:hypothetical protein